MGDFHPWLPSRHQVSVPGGEVTFTCLDDGPTDPIAFRVREAGSGAPIPRFRVALLLDRERRGVPAAAELAPSLIPLPARFGETAFEGVPRSLPLHWFVEAEGRQAVEGGRADLQREGDRLVAEVRMPASWWAHLWFGTRDGAGGQQPLEGVAVRSGTTPLARSLGDGHALLELGYDLGAIGVHLEGWRVASWEGFRDGLLVEPRPVHRVWIVREEIRPPSRLGGRLGGR